VTSEFANIFPNWDIQEHLRELNIISRKISFALIIMCVFWSFSIDNMITHWLGILPLETGPNNENMSIYGPFEWLQLRWAAVILLALLSLLPLISIQSYSFASPGLYPTERNWLVSVLILTTTIIPIVIFLIWYQGIPILFELSEASGRPDGVLVRYDAYSIFSIGMAISWVLVVWSMTTISLSLTRIFGMINNGQTRFRKRLLAISTGVIILTLPIEFDGLKIIIGIISAILADFVSGTMPVRIIS
tara:strand:- start:1606 stop:2346 length:741 start_codon:yes stop_codon:yes gene_type:complete